MFSLGGEERDVIARNATFSAEPDPALARAAGLPGTAAWTDGQERD